MDVAHRPAAQRMLDLLRLMAGHHQDRARVATTARCPPRARSSACRSGRPPAACCAAPCGGTAAGRQHHRGDRRRAARRGAGPRRGRRLLARQRARVDLLQQPADAHAHDLGAARPAGRRTAAAARSRCRSASGCARSRAAPAPGVRRSGRGRSGCPGSTGMPKCRISPPAADDAGRARRRAGPPPPRRRPPAACRRPARHQLFQRLGDRRLPHAAHASGGSSEPVSPVDPRCGRLDRSSQ